MKPSIIPPTETLKTIHIVRTPGVCGSKPRIEGHRIKVEHIAVCYERMGMSADEIVTSHPTITLAQVHAARAYDFEHKQDIDADIEEGKRFAEELKAKCRPRKRLHGRITQLEKRPCFSRIDFGRGMWQRRSENWS